MCGMFSAYGGAPWLVRVARDSRQFMPCFCATRVSATIPSGAIDDEAESHAMID
jgi:hypothetical protein